MKNNKTLLPILFIMLHLTSLKAQVITNMTSQDKGIITTTENGALTGDEFGADGIIFEWNQIVRDFEEYNGGKEIESIASNENKGALTNTVSKSGKIIRLPEIIDENGIDIFLLTEDGISIYMTLDNPVYYQEPDADIIKWIRYYAYQKREYTKRLFQRYNKWEKNIKNSFNQKGIPEEIAELCMIESGCTANAISPAGAAGMWQIMPETGRRYGMIINRYYDERFDPEKSIATAAKILYDNRSRTGDWSLAIAAYNCGCGRVQGYQKKGYTKWETIKERLPKETKQYLPSLLAIHYVWTNREKLKLV